MLPTQISATCFSDLPNPARVPWPLPLLPFQDGGPSAWPILSGPALPLPPSLLWAFLARPSPQPPGGSCLSHPLPFAT